MARNVQLQGSLKATQQAAIAAVLSPEPVTLKNTPSVPHLPGVLGYLGVDVERIDDDELLIDALEVTDSVLPANLTEKIGPVSQLFFGPLLTRTGRAALPIENAALFTALGNLGVQISREDNFVILAGQVQGGSVALLESERLDTLTVVLAAVAGRGVTMVQNAAQEPEVDNTLNLLTEMGAQVARTEPEVIVVEGVALGRLCEAEHEVIYDRDQTVVEVCQALAAGEEIQIENVEPRHLTAFLSKLDAAGANYKIRDNTLHTWREGPLRMVELNPKPFPGFEPQWVGPFERMIDATLNI